MSTMSVLEGKSFSFPGAKRMQMNKSARVLYMACGKGASTTSVSVELLLMEYDDATAPGDCHNRFQFH